MHDPFTILFTSAGRRNQLIDCFRADAELLGMRVRILAADMCPQLSSACHCADASFAVPPCTDDAYVPALLEISAHENVTLLVPTIDPELGVLSAQRDAFAAIGTCVLISSPDVVRVAGNKLSTASYLAARGIKAPRTLTLTEYLRDPQRLTWPVIAKPIAGSASLGIVRPREVECLRELAADEFIVQELLSGQEYTVNMFFDERAVLRCVIPHLRIEVRAGEVSKGRVERLSVLEDIAHRMGAHLAGARGPLCFQAYVADDGSCSAFEINARFGGGYPLSHRAGARFPQWILEEMTGRPLSAHNNWRSGVTMLRYDEAVFLDE
jgi:carbamoyl-phosphate synthase large subunit